jgi:rSAM-associated Gly-rich repeat protein
MIKEEALSLRQKYLKILSNVAPAGAVGASLVVLGGVVPGVASEPPAGVQGSGVQDERVSERLAAIREAVSASAKIDPAAPQQEQRVSWWCNGWGCGWGGGWGNGFPNWHNWGNGWGNGWRY